VTTIRKELLWVTVLALAATAACTSIVGGGAAEAEVSVFADTELDLPTGVAGSSLEAGPALQPTQSFEGTIRVRLRVFLVSGAFPISISGGDQEVEIALNGDGPVTLDTFLITPGLYQGLRVVFTEVSADLTSGLGAGEPSEGGVVTVDLGNLGALTAEEDFQILLRDDLRLRVTVELRAPEWLATVASGTEPWVVSSDDFIAAVRLDVRPE
jgi:hypothetical protein